MNDMVNIVSHEKAVAISESELVGVCKRSCSSILVSADGVESWVVISWLSDEGLKRHLYNLAEKRYVSLGWMANMRLCPFCKGEVDKRVDILPKMKALVAEVF